MNEQNIRIQDHILLLKRKWRIIVIITLLSSIVSIILNFFIITPTYESSTKVFIGKEKSASQNYENNDVEMYQKLLKTYSELVQTNDLVKSALDADNINMKTKDVLNDLNVTLKSDTQVLYIAYENKNKYMAKDIVESITNELIKESEQLIPNVSVAVIEKAQLPEFPKSPKKAINITLSSLIGLISGVAFVFLLEYLNNTFNNRGKLEDVTAIPVIGLIRFEQINKCENSMFTVEQSPKSIDAESYRILKTNIQYSLLDKQIKSMVITSSQAGEGKSTIADNLALSFAQNNKKVILVDCNLRKPSLHKMFKISNSDGITDVLMEKTKTCDAIKKCNTNLDVLSSGKIPLNLTEVLESKSMEELLNYLKSKYDVIILDSPPLNIVADAQILSTKVDGTVFVVRADKTKREAVIESENLLNKFGNNILGSVLNGVVSVRKRNCKYNGKHCKK